MKILLVHNAYREPGGEDVVFRQEAELLARFGHTVLTYLRSNHEIRGGRGRQLVSLGRRLIWAEDTWRDISRILRQEKPSVVHVHNAFTQVSPSVYTACQEAGVPVVQTLHNFRLLCPAAVFYRQGRICEECATHGLWRGIAHGCYRGSYAATTAVVAMVATHRVLGTWKHKVNRYIALSEFSRRKFVEGNLPPERISVKPNFVHPDPGMKLEKGRYAVFVGRLSEEKGLRTLLHAWARIGNSIPLLIAGDGPLRNELEEESERAGLSSVILLGRVKHAKVLELMQEARLSILPSECYENFPMAIVESFACGTPVICSRLGAMQEIVEDRRTGLLFTPSDGDDLAEKIMWAWNHPRGLQGIRREARREYERKYTAERNYTILTDIYTRAMGGQQAQECNEVERYGRAQDHSSAPFSP